MSRTGRVDCQVEALAHDPAALEEAQSVVRGAQLMLGSARQQLEALEKVTKPLEQVHQPERPRRGPYT